MSRIKAPVASPSSVIAPSVGADVAAPLESSTKTAKASNDQFERTKKTGRKNKASPTPAAPGGATTAAPAKTLSGAAVACGALSTWQRAGISDEKSLPQGLRDLLSAMDANAVDYPERASQMEELQRYLADGRFDLAEFKAGEIIAQQNNLKAGLPQELKDRLAAMEANAIDYPGRAGQVEELQRYLANGRFELAEFKVGEITAQQDNMMAGLPQELKDRLASIEANAVDYPERASQMEDVQRYLANGRFDLAEFKAGEIAAQQDNLKAGLPQELKDRLASIEANAVDYPERASQMEELQRYLANGRFDLVDFKSGEITAQQNNLKAGLPQELKDRLASIEANAIEYPGRAGQMEELQRYLANGRFDLVEFKAGEIIAQQDNLRG
jgi:uncharacterized protein YqeY